MSEVKRLCLALSLGVATALLLAAALQASSLGDLNPVVLDPGFDGDGIATTDIGGNDDFGSSVVMQPDGKIVVAGTSISDTDQAFAVIRYKTDGSLDSSFGAGGVVTTPLSGEEVLATDLALQSDGRIVVVGTSGEYGDTLVTLARYETNGDLDNNFGSSGIVTTTYSAGTHNWCDGVVLTTEDKWIVVAGTVWTSDYDFALARFDSSGQLDTSFGSGGIITTDLAGDWDFGYAIAFQPADEKIIVGGRSRAGASSDYDFALARYNSDGTLDATFGKGGIVTTSVSSGFDSIYALAVQTDGKIVAAGMGHGSVIALARYNTAGTLDSSFSNDGILTATRYTNSEAYDIVLQPDGKIVIVGTFGISLDDSIVALARFASDGTLDTSFGGGLIGTSVGTGRSGAYGVALQSDGKIVVTGFSEDSAQLDVLVLRYGAYTAYVPVVLRSH